MEEKSLALEIFKELKTTIKRLYIIIVILIFVIIGMIVAFFIHEGQFETIAEENTQEAYYTDNSVVMQSIE